MKRFNISHEYDFDLWKKGVYDAKNERLSQICAFLNPVRQKVEKALDIQSELKLSSGYVLYFYLLNLSDSVIAFAEKNDEKSSLSFLEKELSRLFTFNDFKRIVNENGLVPVSAMTDAAHHHKGECVYVLENRLRLAVKQLFEKSENAEKIRDDIVSVLNDGLGTPPEKFTFSYIKNGGNLETSESLTPKEFFEKFCDTEIESYAEVTDGELMKKCAAAQIKDGEQVVVLCDIRHQSNQMLGILDSDFVDTDDMFGAPFSLSKEEKLRFGIIRPLSYLSLDGAAFDENENPLRFKAQDSHGSETGADGHYTMSQKWFDDYVLSAIINKKYLP